MGRKLWLILLALVFSTAGYSKDIPKPNEGDRAFVKDVSDILTEQQELVLCQKLLHYFDTTSTQIVVLIEPSLQGDDLFEYTHKVARGWGIGEKDKNNGILIFIATKDRKVRIHTGYGMEGSITDLRAERTINNIILPAFKKGDFYRGISDAADQIIAYASGEFTNDGRDEKRTPSWLVLLIVFLILVVLISFGGGNNNKTYSGRRPFYGGGFGGGFGGGSFGGSGGGSFGGFGGGSFGGGGASGSW